MIKAHCLLQVQCLVCQDTNDVTSNVRITESDWMREDLVAKQIAVRASTRPLFPSDFGCGLRDYNYILIPFVNVV